MQRFANPFSLGLVLWIVCFVGYAMDWSDLCRVLDFQLVVFFIYLLILLLSCCFLCRRMTSKSVEDVSKEQNTIKLTVGIAIVLFAGMVWGRSIPILSVAQGMPYNSQVVGVPYIGAFTVSLALFQGFRVSFLFFNTKNYRYLLEGVLLFVPFVLMLQRQNLIIMFVGFIYAWIATRMRSNTSLGNKILLLISILVIAAFGLYIFGIIGNVRYGMWAWNDSSMIAAVGYMNDKYPSWLPREYFWTYIYIVTPLVNLNNNILVGHDIENIALLLAQFFPTSVTRIFGYAAIPSFLCQPSLNVSTAFIQPFLSFSYAGMYIYVTVVAIVLLFVSAASKWLPASSRFAVNAVVCYFIAMMLFDNPATYLTTGYLLLICICLCSYMAIKTRGKYRFARKRVSFVCFKRN